MQGAKFFIKFLSWANISTHKVFARSFSLTSTTATILWTLSRFSDPYNRSHSIKKNPSLHLIFCRSSVVNLRKGDEETLSQNNRQYETIGYHSHNLKTVKNTLWVVLPKSNTSPWVFFKFFKLYKWYQNPQSLAYCSKVTDLLFSDNLLFEDSSQRPRLLWVAPYFFGFFCTIPQWR